MVIVSAGRRVDAPGADSPRFPPANVVGVREHIRSLLVERKPSDIVCAAACGTDLLLLDAAGELKIRRHIILSSSREEFRKSSVADRPGGWELLYDRVLLEADREGGVHVLRFPSGQEGYLAANVALLDNAARVASERGSHALALVIWNGKSRGTTDVTAHFKTNAEQRKLPVVEVLTLD